MTTVVKVGHAKTHLSELLARVEHGEEIVIARGERPVARLTGVQSEQDAFEALVAEIKAARATYKKVTQDEIRRWKAEGRR